MGMAEDIQKSLADQSKFYREREDDTCDIDSEEESSENSMEKKDLISSFSGGETSAYMSFILSQDQRYNCHHIFANTGEEDERTLDFVNAIDKLYGLNVIWLEAVVHHGERVGTTHKIVTYETASRNGEPFKEVIKKYGIPNKAYPHCTRELKLAPIKSWMKEMGLSNALSAVGIRADEMDRISSQAEKNKIIYPLIKAGITKKDIKKWWSTSPVKLGLDEHEGNCKWCWKKSPRKLITLAIDRPEIFNFPRTMEKKHGLSGHNIDGTKRVFFRGNKSTKDIFEMAEKAISDPTFKKFTEPDYTAQHELDLENGCGESCEVYADE